MSINTRQTIQERTYSLKNFGDYFDGEILRQYHGQAAPKQQLYQNQRQNSVQQQAIHQDTAPRQGQKQQPFPKQNQIRQKNIQ